MGTTRKNKVNVRLRMDNDLYTRLREVARSKNVGVDVLVEHAVRQFLFLEEFVTRPPTR